MHLVAVLCHPLWNLDPQNGYWAIYPSYIDVKEASIAVNTAIDYGITLFDTAEVYGPYLSEELLSKAMGNKRKEIVLVSKVGFQYDDSGKILGRNSQYGHVIERTEGCLRRLDTDFLDLLLICLLYTSPSPRDGLLSRMPSSA